MLIKLPRHTRDRGAVTTMVGDDGDTFETLRAQAFSSTNEHPFENLGRDGDRPGKSACEMCEEMCRLPARKR